MKYASIPTTYKGINFRSRLEAKWACFFDLLEWRWEYEPVDLNKWIPDFVINGVDFPIYVEVKPFFNVDDWVEVNKKIQKALNFKKLEIKMKKIKRNILQETSINRESEVDVKKFDLKQSLLISKAYGNLWYQAPKYLLLGASPMTNSYRGQSLGFINNFDRLQGINFIPPGYGLGSKWGFTGEENHHGNFYCYDWVWGMERSASEKIYLDIQHNNNVVEIFHEAQNRVQWQK